MQVEQHFTLKIVHGFSHQIWIISYFSGVLSDQKHFSESPYHEKYCLGIFQNQSNTKEHTITLEFQSKELLKPIVCQNGWIRWELEF